MGMVWPRVGQFSAAEAEPTGADSWRLLAHCIPHGLQQVLPGRGIWPLQLHVYHNHHVKSLMAIGENGANTLTKPELRDGKET